MNVYERPVAERLQAEAARIPLPPRDRWIPRERSRPRLMPMLATLAVLSLVVLVAAPLLDQLNSRAQVASSPLPQAVAVAPTANAAPTQYEASVLLSDARDVTALAISDPLLVLAKNVTGARPSETPTTNPTGKSSSHGSRPSGICRSKRMNFGHAFPEILRPDAKRLIRFIAFIARTTKSEKFMTFFSVCTKALRMNRPSPRTSRGLA